MTISDTLDRRPCKGAPVPLFERLIDDAPQTAVEVAPFRALDHHGLAGSVCQSLEWLLSTRAPVAAAELVVGQRTTLDYGVPDFGTVAAHGKPGMDRLARQIEAAINAYEPRLKAVRVAIALAGTPVATWTLTLTADLVSGDIQAPFQFETRLTQAARRLSAGAS